MALCLRSYVQQWQRPPRREALFSLTNLQVLTELQGAEVAAAFVREGVGPGMVQRN